MRRMVCGPHVSTMTESLLTIGTTTLPVGLIEMAFPFTWMANQSIDSTQSPDKTVTNGYDKSQVIKSHYQMSVIFRQWSWKSLIYNVSDLDFDMKWDGYCLPHSSHKIVGMNWIPVVMISLMSVDDRWYHLVFSHLSLFYMHGVICSVLNATLWLWSCSGEFRVAR